MALYSSGSIIPVYRKYLQPCAKSAMPGQRRQASGASQPCQVSSARSAVPGQSEQAGAAERRVDNAQPRVAEGPLGHALADLTTLPALAVARSLGGWRER
jgi:hypothetical protein